MNKKLIALLIKLGIITADKEADAVKALEALPSDDEPKPKVDPQTITDPAMRAMVESLNKELASVVQMNKQLIDAMSTEKKAREDAQKTIDAQMKAESKKKVDDTVAKALAEGRIAAADKDTWTKVLENDFDSSSKILTALPVNPALQKAQGAQGASGDKSGNGAQSEKTLLPAAAVPGPIGRVNQDVMSKVMSFGNVQN